MRDQGILLSFYTIERYLSGPSVVLSGGGLLEFYERWNEVVFGKVHISSHVWSLSTSSGARDGCKPA